MCTQEGASTSLAWHHTVCSLRATVLKHHMPTFRLMILKTHFLHPTGCLSDVCEGQGSKLGKWCVFKKRIHWRLSTAFMSVIHQFPDEQVCTYSSELGTQNRKMCISSSRNADDWDTKLWGAYLPRGHERLWATDARRLTWWSSFFLFMTRARLGDFIFTCSETLF